MICVLDTSAAFEVALNGNHAEQLRSLLKEADTVISSSLYLTEIPNVIWKYVRAGQLSESDGSVLLAELYQYVDEFTDCPENAVESLHEAVRLGHPVYDLFFLTLARRNNATLLTKDKRLSDLAKELGVPVAE